MPVRLLSALCCLALLVGCSSTTSAETTPSPTSPVREVGVTTAKEVTVGAVNLPGILQQPRGQAKKIAAVLISGSGPNDMDSTIGANKPLRLLAEGLAQEGITTLRFDKRTRHPHTMGKEVTLDEEYFEDIAAAVKLLKTSPDLRGYKIFLIGHSLGAMVAPEVLLRDGELSGAVMMAGSPRSLWEVAYDQVIADIEASNVATTEKEKNKASARKYFDALKAVKDPKAKLSDLPGGLLPASYVVSINNLHPERSALAVDKPLMILQGENDKQVSLTRDFRQWQKILEKKKKVSWKTYPGLSHIFGKSAGKTPVEDISNLAPMEPVVIRDIAEWLTRQ